MRETIKDYLTFSKKERTGIFVLMAIIVFVALVPTFYTSAESLYGDSTDLSHFRDKIVMLEKTRGEKITIPDSASGGTFTNGVGAGFDRGANAEDNSPSTSSRLPASQVKMSEFDPNLISVEGWMQLGLTKRTATTIDKYRSKGGKFRKPEDLFKIYGLSEADKKRLIPFVRITVEKQNAFPSQASFARSGATADAIVSRSATSLAGAEGHGTGIAGKSNTRNGQTQVSNKYPVEGQAFKRKVYSVTDINTADTTGWTSLPGIGPVLSQRIIKYRERLGGFYSVDQVAEVYGLQDSVFQKIRPFLHCVSSTRKINVNGATPEILEQHPYLRRQLARAIVDYRSQHGSFKQLSDLRQVIAITAELFERMSPYLEL